MPPLAEDKPIGRTSPRYTRVRDWLLKYIEDEDLRPGDRIPSERSLAELLGLSRPTISRAVWELVEQGILTREQGNGTFLIKRQIRQPKRRTITIGMFMPFLTEEPTGEITGMVTTSKFTNLFRRENISADIVHGLLSILKEHVCRLVVHHLHALEEEVAFLNDLSPESLDGAVVMPDIQPSTMSIFKKTLETGPPLVFVDRYLPDLPIDRVVSDNFGGTRDAVSHLISKGHRRIAYFTHFIEITSAMDREAGYRAALEDAGIPFDPEIVCGPHIARNRWSYEYPLKHCMSLPDPITAAFGMNDDMVWGAIMAASKLGIAVPDQLEVAGFFDAEVPRRIPFAFTRVVQARYKIGQLAAQLILDRIQGTAPPEARHVLVAPKLITPATE